MSAKAGIGAVIGGFVTILVGMYLASPLASAASSANTSLASYSDAQTVVNTVPIIFAVGLLIAGVVMIILGALNIKKG